MAETLNEDQIKERYHVLIEGDAKSGRLLLYRLAEQKVRSLKKSGISEPKQLQVPADEDYRKNFYASLDKKIMKKGVSAGKASGVELTLDVIQEFNIPLHTFKLATMLGRESEHARMVSTLTGSKRKY